MGKASFVFISAVIKRNLKTNYIYIYDFPGGSDGKPSVYNVGDLGLIPGLGSYLEKEMATHTILILTSLQIC